MYDFETFLTPPPTPDQDVTNLDAKTHTVDEHSVSGFCSYYMTDLPQYQTPWTVYSGSDVMTGFYKHVMSESETIRAEDVNEANPVGVRNMSPEAESLPSIVINDSVILDILKPLMTATAWRKLGSAVLARKRANIWKCACYCKDTADDNCVECDSCLEWYHWLCVGIERAPHSDWFCYSCRLLV